MNIKAPVNVPPIMPITKSKRGTISAIRTATAIIDERTMQRLMLNALERRKRHLNTHVVVLS